MSRLQALMHAWRLHLPGTLPLAKTSRREPLDFRVSHAAIGNATFGARGARDDLILAVRWRPAGQWPRDHREAVAVRAGVG